MISVDRWTILWEHRIHRRNPSVRITMDPQQQRVVDGEATGAGGAKPCAYRVTRNLVRDCLPMLTEHRGAA